MNYELKKMRILLVGDYSFVHYYLRQAFAGLGHDVVLMSDGEGARNVPRDIDVARDMRYGTLGGLKVLWTLVRNARRLRGYDVVVIYSYNIVPLRARWNVRLLRYLKKHNRFVVAGCNGDDPQVMEMLVKGVPRYSEVYWNGRLHNMDENHVRFGYHAAPESIACWKEVSAKADVITPCLYEYWLAYSKGPYAAKSRYMALPMRIPDGVKVKGTGDRIKVLVGVHSNREYLKGARLIGKMVEEVGRRHPGRLDIRYVENVPYGEYCAMLAEADVQVDQLYSFTPSMNSLAAMANGTVVIGGGEEEYYDFIGEKELRPIVNVSPEKTFDENVKAIEDALVPEGNVSRLSRQSIEFVRKHHEYRKIAAQYIEMYNEHVQR